MLLGLISDTHGYFDPRLPDAFRGVERILHAGDIGNLDVIDRLEAIAPVVAVHGNMDNPLVANRFPADTTVDVSGLSIYLVHRPHDARFGPHVRIVVEGHTHRSRVEEKDGILYVNPGAAGKTLTFAGRTVALLEIDGDAAHARIVALDTP
ncbi:MAG TPA: metallophosphoesterase family protein [Dehalococcoidia bacterium]|nr:metallophosphoesterase family protein [Dehalococcoidia bacterium]